MTVPYFETMSIEELLVHLDIFLENQNWESAADAAEEFLGRKEEGGDAVAWKRQRYLAACTLQRATMHIVAGKARNLSAMHAALGRSIVEVGLATERALSANALVASLDPTNPAEEPAPREDLPSS